MRLPAPVLIPGVVCVLAAIALSRTAIGDERSPRSALFTNAMATWVASLDADQRKTASYEFDDDERFDFRLAPFPLEGLLLEDMTEAQSRGLHDAFAQVLSASGLAKVDAIRSLETEVAEMEDGLLAIAMRRFRRPQRYFLALFGEPQDAAPWGLRFDGHHVSLNWTVVPNQPVAVTPLFLGAQPRQVPTGMKRAGLRVLAAEEELALALVRSLTPEQRQVATIPLEEGSSLTMSRPMFVGEGEHLDLPNALGLARTGMTPQQVTLLDAVVDLYVANFAEEVAARYRDLVVREAGTVRFVFAGSDVAGKMNYYRVQGESFLVEFDNTAPGADHVHAVWRERNGDFGRDLLADHYHAEPHAGPAGVGQ